MTKTKIGGDYNFYAKEDIIHSMENIITETGVSFGKPKLNEIENQAEIEIKISKGTFLPLGITDSKGKIENKIIAFEIKVKKGNVKIFLFCIRHNGRIVFSKKIIKTINSGQNIIIEWDGFSNSKIYDSSIFVDGELTVEIIGKKVIAKDVIKSKYQKAKWVDVKIDNNFNKIDVTLRVNLKDGGRIGNDIPKYSFSDLEIMTLEGLKTYWSRNKTRSALVPATDFVIINGKEYLVTVNPINVKENAMDDISLIYNSTTDWKRSCNPGSITGVLSFFANIFIPERVVYNSQQRNEERYFKLTSAHEIGHEIIKTFGGEEYSYAHEGSSTLLTQKQKINPLPITGENNLMEYYNDGYYDYDRTLATEKDVLGLIWCSIIKVR